MNKFIKILVATAIAGLVAGVAHAVEVDEVYGTDNASFKISGARCDTESGEEGLELALVYGVGPNTGTWMIPEFFNTGEGPFVSHRKMRRVQMGLTWTDAIAVQEALTDFVEINCTDVDVFHGAEVARFDAIINKSRTRAKLRFNVNGSWEDVNGRVRKVKYRLRANMVYRNNGT